MARSRTELDPRFRRLMQRLPDSITDSISAEIAQSAILIAADASSRVPVDTGALRDSIGIRTTKTSAEVGFDPKRFRRKWKRAGWRAKFTELGTKGSVKRNIPAQAARPFLRPAFEANRQEIMRRHRAAVAQVLHRAASL
jgi:HK97 gp10 family phage protein